MGIGLEGGAELLPSRYINELKRFVEGGYTIPEALVAATKTSAEILDMDDKLGTIESGKLADVIVIDGKPDIDLDDLANTDLVVRDGYIVVKRWSDICSESCSTRSRTIMLLKFANRTAGRAEINCKSRMYLLVLN